MEAIIKHISSEGTIKTAEVVADGISKFDYYRYLKQNNFEKIAPGLFSAVPEAFFSVFQFFCTGAYNALFPRVIFYYLMNRLII